MRQFFLLFFFLAFALEAEAGTYHVRADGLAGSKASATDPASASTSMSVTTFNGETFSAGDTIYFSSRGGNYTTIVDLPSGGSSGNPIYYKGEPGFLPTWTTNHWLVHQSYVEVHDITVDSASTSNFEFGDGINTYVGLITYNLIARNSGNQCTQHLGSTQVDHYNLTTSGAVDEGLSMHDSPTVRIFGGNISGYNGINWVGTGSLELYDVVITAENSLGRAIQPAASTYQFKAHRCIINDAGSSDKYLIDFNASGDVEFVNCIFKNLGTYSFYILFRSALTTAKLINCTFYSGGLTGAVVFNQKTTGIYKNNIFHTTTGGTGKAYYAANGVDNTCYYGSGTVYYGTNYVTSDPSLVDPANGDLHLQASSPCIDAGLGPSSDANVPTTDIDGESRSGTTCDIGADEFVVSTRYGAPIHLGAF